MKIFALAFMALVSLCSVSEAALVGMNGVFTGSTGAGIFGDITVSGPKNFVLFVTNGANTSAVTSWTLGVDGFAPLVGTNGTITLNDAGNFANISILGGGNIGLVAGAPFSGVNGDFTQANLNLISGNATFTFFDSTGVQYDGTVHVPEPASMFAFAVASGFGAVVYRRRRKKAPAA